MKTSPGIVAIIVGTMVLMSGQAQADIIKHAVRLGAFRVDSGSYMPLTTSGADIVSFSGSGRFTIWYTAECAASDYVGIDIAVDGILVSPTGDNNSDSFCDPDTRGAMHTATGRTHSLAAGTHEIEIYVRKAGSGIAYLSDSLLLIGK